MNRSSCNAHSNSNIPKPWAVSTRKGKKKENTFTALTVKLVHSPLVHKNIGESWIGRIRWKIWQMFGNKVCNRDWEMPEGSLKGQRKTGSADTHFRQSSRKEKCLLWVLWLILDKITHPPQTCLGRCRTRILWGCLSLTMLSQIDDSTCIWETYIITRKSRGKSTVQAFYMHFKRYKFSIIWYKEYPTLSMLRICESQGFQSCAQASQTLKACD